MNRFFLNKTHFSDSKLFATFMSVPYNESIHISAGGSSSIPWNLFFLLFNYLAFMLCFFSFLQFTPEIFCFICIRLLNFLHTFHTDLLEGFFFLYFGTSCFVCIAVIWFEDYNLTNRGGFIETQVQTEGESLATFMLFCLLQATRFLSRMKIKTLFSKRKLKISLLMHFILLKIC